MILEKKELEKMIQHYDELYEKNYHEFMCTGMSRYEKAYHRAEDLADTLRLSLTIYDDHEELVALRGKVSEWRVRGERLKESYESRGEDIGPAGMILDDIISIAKCHGT